VCRSVNPESSWTGMNHLGKSHRMTVRSPGKRADILLQAGLSYAVHDGKCLKLDVARPATVEGLRPLLVVYPGNGWGYFFWFNRRSCRKEILWAASLGYVAASVDYRSAIKAGFTTQLHDAKEALWWLSGHAEEFRADRRRIAVSGFSSGGQLALLLGLTDSISPRAGPSDKTNGRPTIRAVVSVAAPTDMTAMHGHRHYRWALTRIFGGAPHARAESYREASPVAHATSDAPPILVIHGGRDKVVPPQQARLLDRAIARAGGRHRLFLAGGHGHWDFWRHPTMWLFLDCHLQSSCG